MRKFSIGEVIGVVVLYVLIAPVLVMSVIAAVLWAIGAFDSTV